MADPMQDPNAAPVDDAAMDGGAAAYTIEITVTADGEISVGCESAEEENAEESVQEGGGESAEATDAKPMKSIKEALTYALELYKNDGKPIDTAGAQTDYEAGFAGG